MAQELSTHMMKEERILFPFVDDMEIAIERGREIPRSCFDSVEYPIANMVAEHDDAGAILTRIRELTNNYTAPEGTCATFHAFYQGLADFERDLHEHIHLENNILFPRAVAMESQAFSMKSA